MITIIDYKAGNLKSVTNALTRLNQPFAVTDDPGKIKTAQKVIFPGVGRAGAAMAHLKKRGLDKIIPEIKAPFLGICLGMQLLYDSSEEDKTKCLGIIDGNVKKIHVDLSSIALAKEDGNSSTFVETGRDPSLRSMPKFKIPHMGWNVVGANKNNPLFKNLPDSFYAYFVHSYFVDTVTDNVIATAHYGQQFAAATQKDNFFGIQFHPEKSGAMGLKILDNFCRLKIDQLKKFFVIPCIDLLDRNCVRLVKGDFDDKKTYSNQPLEIAKKLQKTGATWLHIVDLNGAKTGRPKNLKIIKEIVKKTRLSVQIGGGVRTLATAEKLLKAGIKRVILSTAALETPTLISQLLRQFGADRVAVSVDVKNGFLAIKGWKEISAKPVELFLKELKKLGLKIIIFTDISKDGTLNGPIFSAIKKAIKSGLNVIAAGGVSSLSDVAKIKKLGAYGVVIGKAWYEGKIDLSKCFVETLHCNVSTNALAKRLIPCLDIKNGRVVKGTSYVNLKDAGDPVELAKLYSAMGADELVFLDIMATVENRPTLYQLVAKIAATINIPFTVGGGVKTIADIRQLLKNGADKVSIGSAAVTDPEFVKEAAKQFGSQCIVISLDSKKTGQTWKICIKGGREQTDIDAVPFARQMEKLGAGELLVNSIDRDGMRQGYDIELLKAINEAVNIPVIASSGAGNKEHFVEVFNRTNVDAALAASLFHYREVEIPELKEYLRVNNIPMRL